MKVLDLDIYLVQRDGAQKNSINNNNELCTRGGIRYTYLSSKPQDEDNGGHLQPKHRIKNLAGYKLTFCE